MRIKSEECEIMEIYNHLDGQNRLYRVSYYNNGVNGQYDTHGLSYLEARKMYQDMGLVMGLEKKLEELEL